MKTNTLFACVIVVLSAVFSLSAYGKTDNSPQVNYEQQVKTNLKELNQQLKATTEDTVISSLHSKIAYLNGLLKNYSEAINHYSLAIDALERAKGKDCIDIAMILYEQSLCYHYSGYETNADGTLTKALDLCSKSSGEDAYKAAKTMKTIADHFYYTNNYNIALSYCEESIELYKKAKGENCVEAAEVLINVGKCYNQLQQADNADKALIKAYELCVNAQGENCLKAGKILVMIGDCYHGLMAVKENPSKAIDCYESAIEKYHEANNDHCIEFAQLLTKTGKLYKTARNMQQAKTEFFKKALVVYEELLRSNPADTKLWPEIAECYKITEDFDNALKYYKQTLASYQNNNNNDRFAFRLYSKESKIAGTLLDMLECYLAKGQFSDADECGLQIDKITKTLKGHDLVDFNIQKGALNFKISHEREQLIQQGDDHYNLKQYDNALEFYSQAYSFYSNSPLSKWDNWSKQAFLSSTRKSRNLDDAAILDKIGRCYYYKKEYNKAINYYQAAREIGNQVGTWAMKRAETGTLEQIMEDLGLCHMAMGEFKTAWIYYQTAIDMQVINSQSYFSQNLANKNKRNDYWQKHYHLYQELYPAAVLADTTIDKRGTRFDFHDPIVYLYDKSALFSKGLLLNTETILRNTILNSGDSTLVSAYKEIQSLKEELTALLNNNYDDLDQKEIDKKRERIHSLDNSLRLNSTDYDTFIRNLNITYKDVQDALGDKDVAIEFLSFPKYGTDSVVYVALTLRKKRFSLLNGNLPVMTVLCEENELKSAAKEAYTNNALSKLIWGNLAQELDGVENIYFSPSGELHNIAIESMPHWENGKAMMRDSFNLYRLTSTRELAIKRAKLSLSSATVYGGINYDAGIDSMGIIRTRSTQPVVNSRSFFNPKAISANNKRNLYCDYLPGTLEEANEVGQKLADENIDVNIMTASEATEESFKNLSGLRNSIVHISTHGFYWNDSTANSENMEHRLRFLPHDYSKQSLEEQAMNRAGLMFSGANNTFWNEVMVPDSIEDGVLTALEVAQLDLRGLDLVVLSACQTGLGEIGSDGVFGLQRGFKKAGAQTIIMSLWYVDDYATRDMMIRFYENYIERHMSKYEAFIEAQHWLKVHDSDYNYEDPDEILDEETYHRRFPHWAAFIMLDP